MGPVRKRRIHWSRFTVLAVLGGMSAVVLLLLAVLTFGSSAGSLPRAPVALSAPIETRLGSWELLGSFPHDTSSFTQGLAYNPSTKTLYESVGLYGGRSALLAVSPVSGAVLSSAPVGARFFGEGIALLPGSGDVVMLTWREKTLFVFDGKTLEKKETKPFTTKTGEGWGIAAPQEPKAKDLSSSLISAGSLFASSLSLSPASVSPSPGLIVSDGSSWLYEWDPSTLVEVRRFQVTLSSGQPVPYLNELEFFEGDILANVWFKDEILRIDWETGVVKVVYDFGKLWPKGERAKVKPKIEEQVDCFNGIAVLDDGQILVTGKLWPNFYRVKLKD